MLFDKRMKRSTKLLSFVLVIAFYACDKTHPNQRASDEHADSKGLQPAPDKFMGAPEGWDRKKEKVLEGFRIIHGAWTKDDGRQVVVVQETALPPSAKELRNAAGAALMTPSTRSGLYPIEYIFENSPESITVGVRGTLLHQDKELFQTIYYIVTSGACYLVTYIAHDSNRELSLEDWGFGDGKIASHEEYARELADLTRKIEGQIEELRNAAKDVNRRTGQ